MNKQIKAMMTSKTVQRDNEGTAYIEIWDPIEDRSVRRVNQKSRQERRSCQHQYEQTALGVQNNSKWTKGCIKCGALAR